jgi:hypothetical protein
MNANEQRWCDAVHSIEDCVLCGRHGVQWSHSNMLRGKSQKSNPMSTAAICSVCHTEIDNGGDLTKIERRELHMRAIVLTHEALGERGQLGLLLGPIKALQARIAELERSHDLLINVGRKLVAERDIPQAAWDLWKRQRAIDEARGQPWINSAPVEHLLVTEDGAP